MLASVLQTARRQNRRNLRGGRFVGSLASLLTRIDQWWRAVAHCSVEEPLDRSQRYASGGNASVWSPVAQRWFASEKLVSGTRRPRHAYSRRSQAVTAKRSAVAGPAWMTRDSRTKSFASDADATFLPVPRSPRTPVEVAALPPVPTFMGRGTARRPVEAPAPAPSFGARANYDPVLDE